ncbi:hypothetical protein VNO77_15660 [Canavalia gladiata]|uniref:DNA polymerase delta catalytic subunit n=1 Tax=Canavalia gladiata TaxID=3824 RepID=A0AAN9LZQ4_CANGL
MMSFDIEREVLRACRDFIHEVDLDTIIGYNIYKFDLPYLIEKANRNIRLKRGKAEEKKEELGEETRADQGRRIAVESCKRRKEVSSFDHHQSCKSQLLIPILEPSESGVSPSISSFRGHQRSLEISQPNAEILDSNVSFKARGDNPALRYTLTWPNPRLSFAQVLKSALDDTKPLLPPLKDGTRQIFPKTRICRLE